MRSANKSPKILYSAMVGKGKLIQNPYIGLDSYQIGLESYQ